jgi:hypothetical protein
MHPSNLQQTYCCLTNTTRSTLKPHINIFCQCCLVASARNQSPTTRPDCDVHLALLFERREHRQSRDPYKFHVLFQTIHDEPATESPQTACTPACRPSPRSRVRTQMVCTPAQQNHKHIVWTQCTRFILILFERQPRPPPQPLLHVLFMLLHRPRQPRPPNQPRLHVLFLLLPRPWSQGPP